MISTLEIVGRTGPSSLANLRLIGIQSITFELAGKALVRVVDSNSVTHTFDLVPILAASFRLNAGVADIRMSDIPEVGQFLSPAEVEEIVEAVLRALGLIP